MSRLKRVAKPRPKKKEVVMTVKLNFEVFNDNEDYAKKDCIKFKDWVRDQFSEWDNSVLEHFLYEYGLVQNSDGDKYLLDIHIDKILKDESSTEQGQQEFMDNIKEIEKAKDRRKNKEI